MHVSLNSLSERADVLELISGPAKFGQLSMFVFCEQGLSKWILRLPYHQGQQGKQMMGFGVMSNLKVNKQMLS